MRLASSLLWSSLATSSLVACKPEQPPPAQHERPVAELELGAHASRRCTEAMAALAQLEADTFREPSTEPLRQWLHATDSSLGRDDGALFDERVVGLESERERVVLLTGLRTPALLEARRLLAAASDADPQRTPQLERASQWDEAWCLWDGALRPLARRADGLPERGGEDWEATIVEAFTAGRAALDDPRVTKVSRQIIEKANYAVAYRLILAGAERPPTTEAAGLLDMLEDRLADRNGPGLARMRRMLNGSPAAVDPIQIERELARGFSKRARKYCDKAVVHAELGSPDAVAEAWEGLLYTKVMLPSMTEALSPEGFDADAYMADWHGYIELIEAGADGSAAAAIAARLVEWNCAYQDRLGIAACSSTSNEVEPPDITQNSGLTR